MYKKILSIFLIITIFQTQIFAYTQSTEYVINYAVMKKGIKEVYRTDKVNDINYSSVLDNLNQKLFSSSNINEVMVEIINKTINESVDEKKRTEFIPKNSNTLVDQTNSAFGKSYSLNYNDDDGIYVGFLENHLSAVSRGYYAKKYSEFDKNDGLKKDFIILGKADFLEDLSIALYDYKINSNHKVIQPLLLSYLNYTDSYINFKEPETYKENSFGWNGLLKVDVSSVGEDDKEKIKSKLNSFNSPITSMSKRNFGTLINGTNGMFQENGKVFHYKTNEVNEELFTHLSMANTFMANNNLKRGFLFKPSKALNNYKIKDQKVCSGKIRKKCTYWQELTYTGGLDVYSMSFLDESYMDDWSEISYLNRDIVTGSVTVPTMVPVNSYAKLPSVNSENYGFLYSTNYAGSIGGYGLYSFPLFGIDGLTITTQTVKSDSFVKKTWSKLAMVLMAVVITVFFGVFIGAGVAIAVYKNLSKQYNFNGESKNLSPEQNRDLANMSNSLFAQTDNKEEENEIMLSTVLYGLMSNNQNYDINKNFMSNSYHNEASKRAKNDLSEVKSSYFGQRIPILENLDKANQFWDSDRKNKLINGYKNAFYNDGSNMVGSGDYASFYDMKRIFRDITRQYIGY